MLYNPKWQVKRAADILSLENLIVWLEDKSANETYNYFRHENCLLAQYFQSCGLSDVSVDGFYYYSAGEKKKFSSAFSDIATPELSWHFWRDTFGAALTRARKYAS